jgi:hypothetical protein
MIKGGGVNLATYLCCQVCHGWREDGAYSGQDCDSAVWSDLEGHS